MHKKKIILGAAFAVMSSLMVAGPASAFHTVEACKEGKATLKATGTPFKNQGQCIQNANMSD